MTDQPKPPAGPQYELDMGDEPAPAAPAAPPVAARPAGAAPAPVLAPAPGPRPPMRPANEEPGEVDDADIKPGMRKDLWKCPHCGCGNQPKRTTCRTCGKSPSEPVAIPWWRGPKGIAAAAAALALVAVLWFATRPDLSLHPAGAAGIDKAERLGGGASAGERSVADKTFSPAGRLAVCGRVLAVQPVPGLGGVQSVLLALGKESIDDSRLEGWKAGFAADGSPETDAPRTCLLHCVWPGEAPRLERGAWLSVVGEHGLLTDGVALIPALKAGRTLVVQELRQ